MHGVWDAKEFRHMGKDKDDKTERGALHCTISENAS
jgi:hypothetical protein